MAGRGRTSGASSLKRNQNPWPELELEGLWRSREGGVPSRTSTSTKPYSRQTSSKEILLLQLSPRSADTLNAIPRTPGPNSLSLRTSHHGMAPPPVPPPILIKLFEAFHTLDCSRPGREISWTWHLLRTGPTRRSQKHPPFSSFRVTNSSNTNSSIDPQLGSMTIRELGNHHDTPPTAVTTSHRSAAALRFLVTQ